MRACSWISRRHTRRSMHWKSPSLPAIRWDSRLALLPFASSWLEWVPTPPASLGVIELEAVQRSNHGVRISREVANMHLQFRLLRSIGNLVVVAAVVALISVVGASSAFAAE